MLHQAGSCVRLTLQVPVRFVVPQPTANISEERREGGGEQRRSLRGQIGGKERERLSQWSCVHSFMSFVSPEEISAKLTEPNV